MSLKIDDYRIVVTGGAGFIGSHLVDLLLKGNASVTVVDDLSNGRLENVSKKARFIRANICDQKKVKDSIINADLIFHLAADTRTRESSMGFKDPFKEMQTNIFGTANIIKNIVDYNPQAVLVFASSAAVYGEPKYTPVDENHPKEPVSPYGISKLVGEKYLFAYMKEYGLNYVIGRIFNTYGPRQSRYVIHDFIQKLTANPLQLTILGDGNAIRDYAYVSDTANALSLIGIKGKYGEIYNIAGGNPISIKNLADLLLRESNLQGKTTKKYTRSSWKGDINKMIADITKITQLGYLPKTTLNIGLKKTILWFKNSN